MKPFRFISAAFIILTLSASPGFAWHDKTHLMVSKVAGLSSWYNSAGPDLAKIKAGHIESYNHYFNNDAEADVTVEMVMNQIGSYNQRNKSLDAQGHLLGAIIAALRAYEKDTRRGKYAEYHLAYMAHYIADLSQPLHNIPYDDFNKAFHETNDGLVEANIFDETDKMSRHLYVIDLRPDHFEEDLAKEIARIANLSRKLGYKLRAANKALSREEAYIQLGHSVSLIQAVLRHYHLEKKRQEIKFPAAPDGR